MEATSFQVPEFGAHFFIWYVFAESSSSPFESQAVFRHVLLAEPSPTRAYASSGRIEPQRLELENRSGGLQHRSGGLFHPVDPPLNTTRSKSAVVRFRHLG